MRCYACQHILSKAEATRRFSESGAFTELCNKCLFTIDDEELALDEGFQDEEEDDDY